MALRVPALRTSWQRARHCGPWRFPFGGWRSSSFDATGEDVVSSSELDPVDLPIVSAPPAESVDGMGTTDNTLMTEFRVSSATDSRSLGCAMTEQLRKHGLCEALASGDEAVSRFVKGASIARQMLNRRGEGDVYFQAHHCFWIDRNSSNQVSFALKRTASLLTEAASPIELLRVRRDTDMRGLAKSIKAGLSKHGRVDVHAMGTGAVARCIVASIWTRRYCMSHRHDIDCYPAFKIVDGLHDSRTIHAMTFAFVERELNAELTDSKALFALRPPRFYPEVQDLPPLEDAFSETLDVELPIVKIAAETDPRKAAAALITFLRSCSGVQVFTTGLMANNQAFKSIAICRTCVREIAGYDLGFQCIHSPRENRNGECQIVTWLRLTQDTSKRLALLDGDKIAFRISGTNDAKSVGMAMAAQIETCHRLDCVAVGPSAVARLITALSHARLALVERRKDLVALPYFDAISSFGDRSHVRLRCDVLCIRKDVEPATHSSHL